MNDVRDNDTTKVICFLLNWKFVSRTDTILSLWAFSPVGHKMFLSRDYPLVVVAQKFDVRKTNIASNGLYCEIFKRQLSATEYGSERETL